MKKEALKTIHFVYSVPNYSKKSLNFYQNSFFRIYNSIPPPYRRGDIESINWPSPILAPFCITYHLLKILSKNYRVKLYDWQETVDCKMAEGDIFIGHPLPDSFNYPYQNDDPGSVTSIAIRKYKNNKRILLTPYNHDANQVGWMKDLIKESDGLIAICGKYWTDTWNDSPLVDLVKKPNYIEMGINAEDYPYVKLGFKPKNKRKFLYIGNTSLPKNTRMLEMIAANMDNFKGGYISNGDINGWERISHFRHLTPGFMKELAEEYDVFLNCSIFDAQATTILEQMCFGLVVACTPQSGYVSDTIIELSVDNLEYNCQQIRNIQNMDIEELEYISSENRRKTEERNSWGNIKKKFVENFNQLI